MIEWASSEIIAVIVLGTTIIGGVAVWMWRIGGSFVPRPEIDKRFGEIRRDIRDDMKRIEARNNIQLQESEKRSDHRFDKVDGRLISMDNKLDKMIFQMLGKADS